MPTRKAAYGTAGELREMIRVARGEVRAELVVRGAQVLDVFSGAFHPGDVAVHHGVIAGIGEDYDGERVIDGRGAYLVPGFIDAHVHLESSLMTPARFQQAVLPCGTTTVIWDPHEIANVKGLAGIRWALDASAGLALDIFVMVPSCVPSTSPEAGLETSGAVLRAADLAPLRAHPRVLGLAEMMNFPGLLGGDADVLAKLVDFAGLRLDGHCPGLSGRDLNAYAVAGIHSCHESTTLAEAAQKLRKGVHVLIREGSCAKDADALLPLLDAYTSACLGLCSDDRNPADIAAEGHINFVIDKGLRRGLAPADLFRAASFAPARLYGLEDRGAVAPGYVADLALVAPRQGADWRSGLVVAQVLKRGRGVDAAALAAVAAGRRERLPGRNLDLPPATAATFRAAVDRDDGTYAARVIGVIPHQILTRSETAPLAVLAGALLADVGRDVLKIAVLERHHGTGGGAAGFVRGFGLTQGAIATSINHDSHNVIVVGSSDELMAAAVNELRAIDGGIVVACADGRRAALPLPIGGLMTDADPAVVTEALHRLKALAQDCGCGLGEPFLQLSFLALPVIPALKITDKGLVDVAQFRLVSLLA